MQISILHEGKRSMVEMEAPCSIEDIITRYGIAPSTVLVVHNEEMVPQNAMVNDDIELEFIIVSSGG